jgi:NADP-dependent 3-hydroxy acid dehydrogenase YdfG
VTPAPAPTEPPFKVDNMAISKKFDTNTTFLGCDTGFGYQLAEKLHKDGFKVFAGCLQKSQNGEGAQQLASQGIDVLQLDVTSESDWISTVEHLEKNASSNLWGLVHNAGWSTFGDVEWIPMSTYRKIAEVNMFGLMMGTQKVLPLLRRYKGRIVTITSGLVRGSTPSRSPYIYSKIAMVGFLECLRYEMKRFDVQVLFTMHLGYCALGHLGLGVLGSLGSWGSWAPRALGLLWLMGSSGSWAPRAHGLLALLGSSRSWAPRALGLLGILGSSVSWPLGLLGSLGSWPLGL